MAIIIIGIGLGLMASMFLIAALFSVSGDWKRVSDKNETIHFGQLGLFVVGRVNVPGGHQTYTGYALGNRFFLKRRDFGVAYLKGQGFPEPLLKYLEGEVMGELKLKLSKDRLFLEGTFLPYKIEFMHPPPKIVSIIPQKPVPRTYSRVQIVESTEITPISSVY